MGRVVWPLREHTTPRVSAIEMPTTDLGLLSSGNNLANTHDSVNSNRLNSLEFRLIKLRWIKYCLLKFYRTAPGG